MIGAIFRLLIGGLWKPVAKALGLLMAGLGIRHHVKTAEKLKDAKEALKTRERIDNAPVADGPDSARRWLRKRGDK